MPTPIDIEENRLSNGQSAGTAAAEAILTLGQAVKDTKVEVLQQVKETKAEVLERLRHEFDTILEMYHRASKDINDFKDEIRIVKTWNNTIRYLGAFAFTGTLAGIGLYANVEYNYTHTICNNSCRNYLNKALVVIKV